MAEDVPAKKRKVMRLVVKRKEDDQEKEKAAEEGKDKGKAAAEAPQPDAAAEETPSDDLFLPVDLPFKRARPGPAYKRKNNWKKLKQLLQQPETEGTDNAAAPAAPSYAQIDARWPVYPPKKYCDVTGLEAKYADPRTKIRYAHVDTYQLLRTLPEQMVQDTLALRNAAAVLR